MAFGLKLTCYNLASNQAECQGRWASCFMKWAVLLHLNRYLLTIGMTRVEALAQSFLFFLAGFDTTGKTLSFLAYSLALNPEVQDKLIEEVDSVLDGKVRNRQT